MTPATIAIIVFFGYLALCLLFGWYGFIRMKEKTVSDYFIANKSLGSIVSAGTYVASLYSAFTFLGAVGIYYVHGMGFSTLVLGEVFLMGILMPTVGYKIWKFSRDRDYVTIADMVADRYGEDDFIRVLIGISMIGFMFFLMGIQIIGISYVVQKITFGALSYKSALLLVSLILAIYIVMGGMRAVAYTDVMQIIIVTITLAAVLVSMFVLFDMTAVFQKVAAGGKAGILYAPGPLKLYNFTYWVTSFIAFGVGMFFWPHLWARLLAAKEKKALWTMGWGMSAAQVFMLGIVTFLLAVVGASLWPTRESLGGFPPDQIIIKYCLTYFPMWLAALLLSGASAAAMSTVDSLVLVLASMALRDVWEKPFKSTLAQDKKVLIGRILTVVFLGCAVVVALYPPGLIVKLIMDTSYPAFCGIAPAIIFGLYWKRANNQGARASIVVGIATALVTIGLWKNPFGWGVYSGFWALLVATIVMIVVSSVTSPSPKEVLERFDLA